MDKSDIYYQIACTEPKYQSGKLARYEAGWIVWADNNINFWGPCSLTEALYFIADIEKEERAMKPKSIESYIEEMIEKQMTNRHIASKGYVRSQITEALDHLKEPLRREINKLTTKNFPESNVFTKEPKRPFMQWEEYETDHLRNALNTFIKSNSIELNRSSASIKAKLFRMFQKSYQKI